MVAGADLYAAGPFTSTGDGSRGMGGFSIYHTSGLPLATTSAARREPAWQLWPNPAHERVQLTGGQAGQAVELYDALGRRVSTAVLSRAGTLELALPATLRPGVYLVRSGGQARRLLVE